jgi:hypothetical protein
MNMNAWFTVDELNKWADEYHLKAVMKSLDSVRRSGQPAEIGEVYIEHLEYGLATFMELVDEFDLTCKRDKTTMRYIVEKPGRAYK